MLTQYFPISQKNGDTVGKEKYPNKISIFLMDPKAKEIIMEAKMISNAYETDPDYIKVTEELINLYISNPKMFSYNQLRDLLDKKYHIIRKYKARANRLVERISLESESKTYRIMLREDEILEDEDIPNYIRLHFNSELSENDIVEIRGPSQALVDPPFNFHYFYKVNDNLKSSRMCFIFGKIEHITISPKLTRIMEERKLNLQLMAEKYGLIWIEI